MSEWVSELVERLIVSRKRDGWYVYDVQAKQDLIGSSATRRKHARSSRHWGCCGVPLRAGPKVLPAPRSHRLTHPQRLYSRVA